MSCSRSSALSLVEQFEKNREKHLLSFWQTLVSLDSEVREKGKMRE